MWLDTGYDRWQNTTRLIGSSVNNICRPTATHHGAAAQIHDGELGGIKLAEPRVSDTRIGCQAQLEDHQATEAASGAIRELSGGNQRLQQSLNYVWRQFAELWPVSGDAMRKYRADAGPQQRAAACYEPVFRCVAAKGRE